ncbi:hypothetical protein V5N11_031365 [Cardamine amara subsp. amara]|uniref:Uncharacterized protein n=1 Tax=Cardamine amara subsp. amara TaxID=228776 RepID=A0ABD1A7D7_CARAN
MMGCLLGNGEKASFWFDNWCSLGIMWDFIGHIGPGRLGIAIDDSVADAWGPNGWYLPSPYKIPQICGAEKGLDIHRTSVPLCWA